MPYPSPEPMEIDSHSSGSRNKRVKRRQIAPPSASSTQTDNNALSLSGSGSYLVHTAFDVYIPSPRTHDGSASSPDQGSPWSALPISSSRDVSTRSSHPSSTYHLQYSRTALTDVSGPTELTSAYGPGLIDSSQSAVTSNTSSRGSRRRVSKWEQPGIRGFIEANYLGQTAKALVEHINKVSPGFNGTDNALKKWLRKWGLSKNLCKDQREEISSNPEVRQDASARTLEKMRRSERREAKKRKTMSSPPLSTINEDLLDIGEVMNSTSNDLPDCKESLSDMQMPSSSEEHDGIKVTEKSQQLLRDIAVLALQAGDNTSNPFSARKTPEMHDPNLDPALFDNNPSPPENFYFEEAMHGHSPNVHSGLGT